MQAGAHKGSVLLVLLFIIAVYVIRKYGREGLMNKILYAVDLVLMSESYENLIEKFLKSVGNFEN